MDIHKILASYWGYSSFRPLQEDIIDSILGQTDTLALMPTGGGKSICYQVPALAKPGLCLVISPLIALMKDQADSLLQKGIRALAIYSGMSYREVERALDNATYGEYKFLFVSPERLGSELFRERVKNMPISLIAVDEAHCISEWGYDFRPAYLHIADIRQFFPAVPILALTATATEKVRKDIQEKLLFRKDAALFEMSFDRKNLVYAAIHEEDKKARIISLLKRVPGTAIIYVRNRKLTKHIATFLQKEGISADYYHGGLQSAERSAKQNGWKIGQIRVIVSTNAFGMGIDKPDVRQVIHYGLPDSLEAYYQEAGRGGRDGAKAFAIALVNESDRLDMLEQLETSYPTLEELKNTYHALCNHYQVPLGSGLGQSFDFDISEFSKKYGFTGSKVYHSLQFLERAEYLITSEGVFIPSRFMVFMDNADLYTFQVDNAKFEPLVKAMLRSYGGCFENYVPLDEKQLAKKIGQSAQFVIQQLNELKRLNIIDYQPQKNEPQITFLQDRVSRDNLLIDHKFLVSRKKVHGQKMNAILGYAFSDNKCRGKMLLQYFGEEVDNDCGHCDYCIKKKQNINTETRREKLMQEILDLLGEQKMELQEVLESISNKNKEECLEIIRWMLDNKLLRQAGNDLSKV